MSESDTLRDIILRLSNTDTRLFRMQSGSFRALHSDQVIRVGIPGMSDTIGLRRITVTPELLGRSLAVFVAIEVKSKTGKPHANQLDFVQVVSNLGGYAGIARSVDDARRILRLIP